MSQQINLFNPIFLAQKKYFSAAAMMQGLALIVGGSLLLAAYMSYQVSALEKEAQATSAQLASMKSRLAGLNAAQEARKKDNLIEEEIRKTEFEIQAMRQVLDTVGKGDFGNTKGYAEYMRGFSRQIVNGVWLTGFSISGAGNEITLEGRALKPEQVPAYIARLKREPALQGKSFASLEVHAPRNEQGSRLRAGEAEQPAPVPYVEFNLQSYREHQAGASASGAKAK